MAIPVARNHNELIFLRNDYHGSKTETGFQTGVNPRKNPYLREKSETVQNFPA